MNVMGLTLFVPHAKIRDSWGDGRTAGRRPDSQVEPRGKRREGWRPSRCSLHLIWTKWVNKDAK